MAHAKYYPPELQKRILQDLESEGSIAAVCRRYGVCRNTVKSWMAKEQQGLLCDPGTSISNSEVERIAKEVGHLKRLLGEKELEIAILKDLVKKTAQRSKTKSK
jgi:transposase-like protein